MPEISSSPRPKGNQNLWIFIIATAIICSFLGIVAIIGFAAFSAAGGQVLLSQYNAPPPASPPYMGSMELPPNLPAPPPFLTEAKLAADPTIYSRVPMPPQSLDFKSAAVLAASQTEPALSAQTSPSITNANPAKLGLFVCPPVAVNSPSASSLSLGSACADWLYLIAAGQPQFGRTMLWSDTRQVEANMGRTDMLLKPSDIQKFGESSPVTDIACGTVSGSGDTTTLTYQLYTVPDAHPIGEPFNVSGSPDQVVAAMPGMARKMDTLLGIHSPSIPASVGATGADMAWIYSTDSTRDQSDASMQKLISLSSKCPVAALDLFDTYTVQDQIILNADIKNLHSQLPTNALALAVVAYDNAAQLRTYWSTDQALFKEYPNSALLAHVETWEQRNWGGRAGELAAADRCLRDSPLDSNSWLTHAQTIENISSDFRGGRTTDDINSDEWNLLNSLYSETESDRKQAITLSPNNGHAWNELLQTAEFAGDQATIQEAVQKAQFLNSDKAALYCWELQMYQPKWDDDPIKLAETALKAVTTDYPNVPDALGVATELQGVATALNQPKYNAMASWVLLKQIQKLRKEVSEYPSDGYYDWNLGAALDSTGDQSDSREALKYYRIAAHFFPNCAKLHFELAELIAKHHNGAGEIAELRDALTLDPFYPNANRQLGEALKTLGQVGPGLEQLKIAQMLAPTDMYTDYDIGEIYFRQNDFGPAAAAYRKATKCDIYLYQAWVELSNVLDHEDKARESIDAANATLRYGGEFDMSEYDPAMVVAAHDIMADDCLKLKQWSDSLDQSHQALAANGSDTVAQENIAEAYWGAGRADDARAQWRLVVSLNDPGATAVANKYLAEHPAASGSDSTNPEIQ